MYLKVMRYKSGKTYLSIAHGYKDKTKGTSSNKTIKKLGYLEDLKKQYDDPITHFKQVAKEMTETSAKEKYISFQIAADALVERGAHLRKNYGHIVFSKIYHELEIDRFLDNARRHKPFKFNSEAIMRLLLFGRILYPHSKKKTFEIKEKFFDNFKFSLDDIYDCLTHFDNIGQALQQFLHERVTEKYNRDTSLIYYDVTNYYFEIDIEDEFRKKGASKEKRHDPIVQMGLALDKNSIPITYNLFPGNVHDSQTYMPVIKTIKKAYGAERIIVVADKGLNSGDNIAFNTALNDGYIFSKSVRGASEQFKEWALSESGFENCNDYRRKSTIRPTKIEITYSQSSDKRRKKKVVLDQKHIVIYSEKYAKRCKIKREQLLFKAADLIANPSKYKRATAYGAAGYVNNIRFDKKTGVVLESAEKLSLDLDKIREEEKYDGYYAIVTSELDKSDDEIIEAYHGLWRIEESFKITKSTLDARPVFLQTKEHINAHFLICFIALLISRIVEIRLGNKYNIEKIINALRQVECSHIDQNYYLFDFSNAVTDDINAVFDVHIGKKIMTLGEIKKNLAIVKNC